MDMLNPQPHILKKQIMKKLTTNHSTHTSETLHVDYPDIGCSVKIDCTHHISDGGKMSIFKFYEKDGDVELTIGDTIAEWNSTNVVTLLSFNMSGATSKEQSKAIRNSVLFIVDELY